MAAIRILVESSTKAFFKSLYDEEVTDSFHSVVDRVINIRNCDSRSPDYIKYIGSKDPTFISQFHTISDQHKPTLSKDAKKNIDTLIKDIDLNMFVHNPEIIATDVTVYRAMQIFSPLLNYIFDILIFVSSAK